ncbi:uncharacterized protein CELE_C46C11.3 [Caenorhabditis elegans]|uniref:Integral membrane protein n=1 Tax=Caenorhabditis elegans TaxID=6239 RepID=Q966P3_CAEEL|nr:Integral membrane protein [Caenorhabditis elegans]CCD67460.1 Integral membrane protein [Caenorhabditis elegans]|eukprot:NP_508792.1 Uncharacterized protein CELE_C46C11.3 [Caenorhabditis elegans]
MELIDKTVELRGSQVLNMHSYHSIIWRRRIMAFATLLAWIGVIMLVAALATTSWATIDFVNTDYHPIHVDLGVWGEYRKINTFKKVTVEWIPHFPAPPENILRLADTHLQHYYRSQAFMGCFGAVILLCTNVLAVYTFYHHRYMYKRAVAALYLVVAMCIFGAIEILSSSINEWNTAVAQNGEFDYEAGKKMGYSTRLAQGAIATSLIACLAFALGSHKQKGEHAATAELEIEDREYHIGR